MAAALVENVATAAFTAVALVLSLVSLRAWWYTRSRKVLLLTIGFALFFVKGSLLSIGLFRSLAWELDLFLPSLLLDLAALAAFYLAALRRG